MNNLDWRNKVEDGSFYEIHPEDFATEAEYNSALNEEKKMWKIYKFCTVCTSSLDKHYHYFTGSANVHVGDHVLVPFGAENIIVVGLITSVGECLGLAFPCSLNKMKTIFGKIDVVDPRVIN